MNSNRKQNPKEKQKTSRQPKRLRFVITAMAAISIAIFLLTACQKADEPQKTATAPQTAAASVVQADDTAQTGQGGNGDGITIVKKNITETATFIPYQFGDAKMEIIAVMAPDGTIRTALNTCQVCWDSGRGYYEQEGDELVCQNCGNRFKISQIEKMKNGCNPVPITGKEKTDNGDTITISGGELAKYKSFFES